MSKYSPINSGDFIVTSGPGTFKPDGPLKGYCANCATSGANGKFGFIAALRDIKKYHPEIRCDISSKGCYLPK